jgi:hypothetical protein
MSESQVLSVEVVKEMMAAQAKQNAESLAEVIKAIKAPTMLEQKTLDREAREELAKNEGRKRTAQEVLQTIAGKKQAQLICNHKHKDGTTHLVHVQEPVGPGYLICQKRQCIIRPGKPMQNRRGDTAIYDTALFNQLFQTTNSKGDILD